MSGEGVWLCAKCGHGSQEHGMPGHPAYRCVADMRLHPSQDGPASRDGALSEAMSASKRWAWRRCKQDGCYNNVWGLGTASPEEPRNCAYHEGYTDALAASREAEQAVERVRALAEELCDFNPGHGDFLTAGKSLRAALDPERAGRGEGGA